MLPALLPSLHSYLDSILRIGSSMPRGTRSREFSVRGYHRMCLTCTTLELPFPWDSIRRRNGDATTRKLDARKWIHPGYTHCSFTRSTLPTHFRYGVPWRTLIWFCPSLQETSHNQNFGTTKFEFRFPVRHDSGTPLYGTK